jgi:hypothetical protein
MTLSRLTFAPVLLIGAFFMTACTTSEAVTAIDAVVTATETLVQSLPGIPPALKADVVTYGASATAFTSCIVAEVGTNDTAVQKASKIDVCAQSLQIPDPAIQVWVSVVTEAIQAFLAPFQTPAAIGTAAVRANTPASTAGLKAYITAPVTLTARDRTKLAAIQKRNSVNALAFR